MPQAVAELHKRDLPRAADNIVELFMRERLFRITCWVGAARNERYLRRMPLYYGRYMQDRHPLCDYTADSDKPGLKIADDREDILRLHGLGAHVDDLNLMPGL